MKIKEEEDEEKLWIRKGFIEINSIF